MSNSNYISREQLPPFFAPQPYGYQYGPIPYQQPHLRTFIECKYNLFKNCGNKEIDKYIFDYDSIKNINDRNQLGDIVMEKIINYNSLFVYVDDLNSIPSLPLLVLISLCAKYGCMLSFCKLNGTDKPDDTIFDVSSLIG